MPTTLDSTLLRALLDSSPHGHIVLDQNWTVVLWNKWMERVVRTDRGDAEGSSLYDTFSREQMAPRLKRAIDAALEMGASSSLSWAFTPYSFPLMQPNNPELQMIQGVSVHAHWSEDGQKTCMIVIEDCTNRSEREALISRRSLELKKLNEHLQSMNEELDAFASRASHDLQEPLRKVISFSELLSADLGGNLNEDAAYDLEVITDATARMSTMIEALLVLSQTGNAAVELTMAPLEETVHQALQALSLRIEEAQAHLQIDQLPSVEADHELLALVFQNLIGNALKFCRDRKPEVRVTVEELDGEVVFGVLDNGIGIDPKRAEEIFAPFNRLCSHSEFKGTGIGLSICQRAIERHGGRIWVESTPDVGSHFRFVLDQATRETDGGQAPFWAA